MSAQILLLTKGEGQPLLVSYSRILISIDTKMRSNDHDNSAAMDKMRIMIGSSGVQE